MKSVELKDKAQAKQWIMSNLSMLQRPCAVLLNGDLGAGKTQFVSWFLECLGSSQPGSSPTFAIHHSYETPTGGVDHLDLYRLENDDQLESCGFWELLNQPKGLLFVEWAERLPDDVWPKNWRVVNLKLHKEAGESRRLEYFFK